MILPEELESTAWTMLGVRTVHAELEVYPGSPILRRGRMRHQ